MASSQKNLWITTPNLTKKKINIDNNKKTIPLVSNKKTNNPISCIIFLVINYSWWSNCFFLMEIANINWSRWIRWWSFDNNNKIINNKENQKQ